MHHRGGHHRRRSDSDSENVDANLETQPAVHVYHRRVVEHESYDTNYKLHKLRPVKELEQTPFETIGGAYFPPPPPVPSQDYHSTHLHYGGSPRGRQTSNNHPTSTSPSSVGLWRPTSNADSTGRLHYVEPKEGGGGRLATYRGAVGKRMGSPQMFANGSVAIRILILILVIIAMILIMTAPGVCFWRNINGQQTSRDICPPSNSIFPMNIDRWTSALHFQMRGQNVWGQLALIILSVLFALPPLIFSCVYFTTGRNFSFSQIMAAGVAVLAFLVFGAVEVWYATGYNHMGTFIRQIGGGTFSGCAGIPACEVGFIVKGWAVAAAFYFLAAILYVLDAILVFLKRDNSSAHRVILQRTGPRTSY